MMNNSNIEDTKYKREDHKANFVSRTIRFFVRLFLLLLFGISLGVAAYFGGPALYKDYIEPLQMNSQRIAELEDELLLVQSDSRTRVSEIGERLAEIEGQQVGQKEILSEIQVEIGGLQTMLKLQNEQNEDLQQLTEKIDALRVDMQNTDDKVEYLTGAEAPIQRLAYQMQLLRVMELLTRTRLWLTQNNFGLALEEIQTAKIALVDLADFTPEEETESLNQIANSLELVLQALPENPVIAADNLEITWSLLVTATERYVGTD